MDAIYAVIQRRRKIEQVFLRRECGIRAGLSAAECWCFKAGEGGVSLPCPPETAQAQMATEYMER